MTTPLLQIPSSLFPEIAALLSERGYALEDYGTFYAPTPLIKIPVHHVTRATVESPSVGAVLPEKVDSVRCSGGRCWIMGDYSWIADPSGKPPKVHTTAAPRHVKGSDYEIVDGPHRLTNTSCEPLSPYSSEYEYDQSIHRIFK